MTKASVSVFKARLSEYLGRVKAGDEILVTDRGRPVARVTPVVIPDGKGRREPDVARLIREGIAVQGSGHVDLAFLRRMRKKLPDIGLLKALLDERAEGR